MADNKKNAARAPLLPLFRGGDDWTIAALFDVHHKEDFCAWIREQAPTAGHKLVAEQMRVYLVKPLDTIIPRLFEATRHMPTAHEAADKFRDEVNDAVAWCVGGNVDAGVARWLGDRLEQAWGKFIEYAASDYMSQALPRDLEAVRQRGLALTEFARQGGKTRAELFDLEHNIPELRALISGSLARNERLRVTAWSKAHNVSKKTIYNLRDELLREAISLSNKLLKKKGK